jgi:hypothetical protein
VKECAAVHLQTAATELPVSAKKEMKPENPVFILVQNTTADEYKISNIFLFAAAPDHAAILPADNVEPGLGDTSFGFSTITKSRIACLKYGS